MTSDTHTLAYSECTRHVIDSFSRSPKWLSTFGCTDIYLCRFIIGFTDFPYYLDEYALRMVQDVQEIKSIRFEFNKHKLLFISRNAGDTELDNNNNGGQTNDFFSFASTSFHFVFRCDAMRCVADIHLTRFHRCVHRSLCSIYLQ